MLELNLHSDVVEGFYHGKAMVATVAAQIMNGKPYAVKGVKFKAGPTNSGIIYIGKAWVTAGTSAASDGFPLSPGEEVFFPVEDVSKIYAIASAASQALYCFVEGIGSKCGSNDWLLRTDGSGTFDPSVVPTSGTATWIYGDGTIETANSASHSYSTTGNYPVSWDVAPELVEQIDVRSDGILEINTQAWTNLTTLYCGSNSLTSLDTFSAWTNLTTLYCGSNSLTSLDTFSAWTNLTTLYCGSNSLTSLDTFSAWTNLTTLYCGSNSLTSLDTFSAWTNLTYLHCYSNSLTSLDTFATWTNLTTLRCHVNSLTSLDTFAAWTSLITLYCYSNSLTSLDTFNTWTSLTSLHCYDNSLTSLNTFSTWTNLTYLRCNNNSLTSLDTFNTWTSLTYLSCNYNSLTSLDTFAAWTNLTTLSCGNNSLTSLDTFAAWTSLTALSCHTNSLPASEIDDVLIALDTAGASSGTLNYSSNPGSADGDRSSAAATSKTNLIARSWVVTV